MLAVLKRFGADESGATAIEYALLGTILGVGLLSAFTLLGGNVANMFGSGANAPANVMGRAAASAP